MKVFLQIVAVVFVAVLVWLAYTWAEKDKDAKAWSAIMIGAVVLLAVIFQGFFETHIIGKLLDYNKKLDGFQETVSSMKGEVDQHQKELNVIQTKIRNAQSNVLESQIGITNQYRQLSLMQTNLSNVQTNIEAQEKKIGDVEYWVENLYGKMTNETFSLLDKDRVMLLPMTNGAFGLICKLNHAPLPNSVRGTVKSGDIIDIPQPLEHLSRSPFDANLVWCTFLDFDSNKIRVKVEYVIDSRKTNLYQELPSPVGFRQTHETNGMNVLEFKRRL